MDGLNLSAVTDALTVALGRLQVLKKRFEQQGAEWQPLVNLLGDWIEDAATPLRPHPSARTKKGEER